MTEQPWEIANKRYIAAWQKYQAAGLLPRHRDQPYFRWPAQYAPLQKGAIVFVGINPSLNLSAIQRWGFDVATLTWTDEDPDPAKSTALMQEHLAALGRLDGYAMYRYFSPMERISQEVGHPWEHIDVFPVRELNQGALGPLVGVQPDGSLLSEFSQSMFGIFEGLVSGIEPRVVVVTNALAAQVIRVAKRVPPLWADDPHFVSHGHHVLQFGSWCGPVLFSGMISGARQLDRGSRERLAWHLRSIVHSGH